MTESEVTKLKQVWGNVYDWDLWLIETVSCSIVYWKHRARNGADVNKHYYTS